MLHALHMSHGVTLDQCDEIVQRHQLLAPHGVWIIDEAHENDFTVAERGATAGSSWARARRSTRRSGAPSTTTRALCCAWATRTRGSTTTSPAVVHSSRRARATPRTSKVCLWWSEFDLDDEEYSCRPKRDASNIVTPGVLLAALANNDVAYPPPSPPPPTPPSAPPPPVAAAGRDPLRALVRAKHEGVQGARVRPRDAEVHARSAKVLAMGSRQRLAAVCGAPRRLQGARAVLKRAFPRHPVGRAASSSRSWPRATGTRCTRTTTTARGRRG